MMDVLRELEKAGAVMTNRHFVYVSGKHGPAYINPDRLFPNIGLVSRLAAMMVDPFVGDVDTVAAPATGGVVFSVLAARALSDRGEDVAMTWVDKHDDDFVVERAGFSEHLKDKRVLVVEDLLNTGGSVKAACEEVRRHGANVVGVSVVCNRGGATHESLEVPRLESLVSVDFKAFGPEDCPECKGEVPIVADVGHGADYRSKHPDYAGGYVTTGVA